LASSKLTGIISDPQHNISHLGNNQSISGWGLGQFRTLIFVIPKEEEKTLAYKFEDGAEKKRFFLHHLSFL